MPRLRPFAQQSLSEHTLASMEGLELSRQVAPGLMPEEELLRAWAARELVLSYQFPSDWLGTRIVAVGHAGDLAVGDSLFGLFVLTPTACPFMAVSLAPQGRSSRAERGLRSAFGRFAQLGLGISTDGTAEGTRFVRKRFDTERLDYLPDIEPYNSVSAMGVALAFVARPGSSSTLGKRLLLQPLTDRVENVFYEAHSHIRDIDGMHADEALDELCKVLWLKMHDEQSTPEGEPYKLQRVIYGSSEELAATVRHAYEGVFSEVSAQWTGEGGSAPPFASPIRLSSPALTKVVETLQPYNISSSDNDIKGRSFQRVLAPASRAGMGQYFTPDPVVKFMVLVCDPSASDLILDPFAGSGHFLTTALGHVTHKSRSVSAEELASLGRSQIHGIEKSDRMVRIAMIDMRMHGDGHSNIVCSDSLLAFENYAGLRSESFDIVMTNPPFGSLLGPEAISRLGSFDLAKGRKSLPLEALGLERCIQFMRPGGRLAIVLPDGLLTNPRMGFVRSMAEEHLKLRAVVSLPIETFVPFGANIKASILFARKWMPGEIASKDHGVFLARLDNVGYDASGRERDGSELEAVTQTLREFLSEEGW